MVRMLQRCTLSRAEAASDVEKREEVDSHTDGDTQVEKYRWRQTGGDRQVETDSWRQTSGGRQAEADRRRQTG